MQKEQKRIPYNELQSVAGLRNKSWEWRAKNKTKMQKARYTHSGDKYQAHASGIGKHIDRFLRLKHFNVRILFTNSISP